MASKVSSLTPSPSPISFQWLSIPGIPTKSARAAALDTLLFTKSDEEEEESSLPGNSSSSSSSSDNNNNNNNFNLLGICMQVSTNKRIAIADI